MTIRTLVVDTDVATVQKMVDQLLVLARGAGSVQRSLGPNVLSQHQVSSTC